MENNKISLSMAITLSVGAIIGSGIFVFTGYGIGYAGTAVPLAFILAALFTVFMTLPTIQLGSAIPATGGSYNYTSRFTHPFFGYIQILNSLIGSLNLAVMSLAFSGYFIALFKFGTPPIVAAITLLALTIVGSFGIKMSGRVQQVIVVILIASLGIYVVQGIDNMSPDYATLSSMFKPLGGFAGLWSAIAVVRYTLQGGTIALTFAEELENPGKDVPMSFFIGTVITAIIYAIVGFVCVASAPFDAIAFKPLSASAELIMTQPWLDIFLVGGGMIATLTTLNGSCLIYSRIHWAAARDGIWPKVFTKMNGNGVPIVALWFCSSVSLIIILFGIDLGRIFNFVAVPALILGPIYMIPGAVMPFKLPNCHQSAFFKMNKYVTVAVAAVSAVISFFLGKSLFDRMIPSDYIGMAIFFGLGTIYWFVRIAFLKTKGIDLVAQMKGYHPSWIEKEEGLNK